MHRRAAIGTRCFIAALCCFTPIGGIVLIPPPSVAQERFIMAETDMLVGTWTKSENPPCAALYPAVLSLQANGLYRGHPEPPREFTTWDVGTWKLVDTGKVAISTANDAVITYVFTLSGDDLRFTDQDGCRFAYRRQG